MSFCIGWLALVAALFPRHPGLPQRGWRSALLGGLATGCLAGGFYGILGPVWAGEAQALLQQPQRYVGLALLLGLGGTYRARRLGTLPTGAILRLFYQSLAAGVCLAAWPALCGTAAPGPEALFGQLLIAPGMVLVWTYLGASVGFLFWEQGRPARRLPLEWWLGRRFLLSRASPVLSTVTGISMTGVGLGVWLVLLTLGILGGFEQDLERKIIGAHAHLEAQSPRQTPFAYTPALQARVAQLRQRPELPLVADAVFVAGEVAIASPTQYTAALMSGVDPIRAPDVLGVLGSLDAAALEALEADATSLPTHPPMLIGREMARSLGVRRGDRVRVISPTLEVLSPLGPTPKSRPFVVAGIFASHMYEHDAHSAYVSLPAARRFLELQADQISSIGLQCKEPRDTPLVRQAWDAATAIAAAGAPTAQAAPALRLIDWRERNQTLFAALNLESRVAFVVLIFIVLVASFSIVNTLTMSVLERQRDIAILKAMGAHDVSIVKIFVMQGLLIGGVGTGVGGLLGIGSLAMLQWVGFAIPGDVLYLDSLPVRLQPVQIVGVLAATLVMVWNFSIVPSLRGAAVLPAEGLRDG